MELMIRIIITLTIVFGTGFCIGMLWGLYIGERKNIMKLSDIKIKDEFKETPPQGWKMKLKWQYYRKNGELQSQIVVNKEGYLVDGYTSYLIAKADGLKEVEVVIR